MKLFLLFLISFHCIAEDGYKGEVVFGQEEKKAHLEKIEDLLDSAKNCLHSYKEEHLKFYNQNCIGSRRKRVCLSKFYGERKYSKKRNQFRSDGTPLKYLPDELVSSGFHASKVNEMEPISCVGLAIQCLKKGFIDTNQLPVWEKVLKFTKENGVGGTAMQEALRNLGWKVFYWNPVPKSQLIQFAKKWDNEEKNWASKGWHEYRYNRMMSTGKYWRNHVDDFEEFVGFKDKVPKKLYSIPFWIGIAHTGYHVFPGTFEHVVEAHSTRHITSVDNLEFSQFNPMSSGGGPRWSDSEKYRSGLLAIPPGY